MARKCLNVLNFSLYYSTQSCGNIQFTGIYLLSATLWCAIPFFLIPKVWLSTCIWCTSKNRLSSFSWTCQTIKCGATFFIPKFHSFQEILHKQHISEHLGQLFNHIMCEFHQPTTVSFSIMTTDERVGRGEKPNFPNSKRTVKSKSCGLLLIG